MLLDAAAIALQSEEAYCKRGAVVALGLSGHASGLDALRLELSRLRQLGFSSGRIKHRNELLYGIALAARVASDKATALDAVQVLVTAADARWWRTGDTSASRTDAENAGYYRGRANVSVIALSFSASPEAERHLRGLLELTQSERIDRFDSENREHIEEAIRVLRWRAQHSLGSEYRGGNSGDDQ
jgi:hypothetical protein